MKCMNRAAAAALLVMAWTPAAAQSPAAPAPVTLTPAQMEEFLLRAKIVRMRAAGRHDRFAACHAVRRHADP